MGSLPSTSSLRSHNISEANLPPADFAGGYRICTEGVPLKGSFDSPFSALRSGDAYDNHQAVDSNLAKVEAKFAKEEERSFHIHLPRFLVYFISSLLLHPIQWAVRKGSALIVPMVLTARIPQVLPIPSARALLTEMQRHVHPYTTLPLSCATSNICGACTLVSI